MSLGSDLNHMSEMMPMKSSEESVLNKVREAFQVAFDVDPRFISMQTSASDVPEWDSVGHLSLASSLEQTFDISLDVEELMSMESVKDIVRVVESKLAKRNLV
jgi:acyl carrier protein